MNTPLPSIFVLGTQRSGTTLLCRMLSAHPRIFIQNELNVRRMFAPGWTREQITAAIERLVREEHGKDLNLLMREQGKDIWGLKDPELTDYVGELEKFLPESRFILIIRDGRAVVNSYMENKWGLGTNAYTGAIRWSREVELQLAFFEKHPANVCVLKYEDLVYSPEVELRRVLDFISVPYHDDVLRYNEMPALYHKTRENRQTYREPDSRLAARWRNKLSRRQIGIIEKIAGETLRKLDYDVAQHEIEIGQLERAYYLLHQKIIGEIQIQYRWRTSMIRDHFRKRKLAR